MHEKNLLCFAIFVFNRVGAQQLAMGCVLAENASSGFNHMQSLCELWKSFLVNLLQQAAQRTLRDSWDLPPQMVQLSRLGLSFCHDELWSDPRPQHHLSQIGYVESIT